MVGIEKITNTKRPTKNILDKLIKEKIGLILSPKLEDK